MVVATRMRLFRSKANGLIRLFQIRQFCGSWTRRTLTGGVDVAPSGGPLKSPFGLPARSEQRRALQKDKEDAATGVRDGGEAASRQPRAVRSVHCGTDECKQRFEEKQCYTPA